MLFLFVASISSLIYSTTFTASFAQVNNTTSANTTSTDNEQSTQDYITNIRLLLNQTIDAYSANDTEKAKELATTAYLDNFEYIEDPIGEQLSEEGEELLRERLGAQIDSNASIEEIKQTVNAINKVLDEAEE
jgi:predicted lipid-binding transport protein (Tim44 family)